jgi:hypothetical protein
MLLLLLLLSRRQRPSKYKKNMAVAERELHVQCAAVRVVRLEEE